MNEQRHLIRGPRWQAATGATLDLQPSGLLMTATLCPPTSAVARSDPTARLNDYLDALRFYLDLPDETINRILFVENSAGDLAPLIDLARTHSHGKTVEFIGFNGNDHPPELGKAYGEFKLIDHGLANTTLFAANDTVWKTTGRLKFLNLPAMVRALGSRPADFVCDLHNLPWVGSRDPSARKHMELRVFAFRPAAYDAVMRGLWRRQSTPLDAADLYHVMIAARGTFKVRPRFPIQPQLQGISGRHGRDYQSPSQRAKDGARAICRRFMPALWL